MGEHLNKMEHKYLLKYDSDLWDRRAARIGRVYFLVLTCLAVIIVWRALSAAV